MDRLPTRLLLVGLLAVVPAAAPTAQELTGTLKKVKDSGRIVIGYREASLPFSYLPGPGGVSAERCEETVPGGEMEATRPCVIGYSIDLCREIAAGISDELDGMPIRLGFRPVTPENRVPALQTGEIDLECGSTTNDHVRRREVAFSPPFFITGTRLLVRKADGIESYSDLRGKTVVVTGGTTNETVLRKLDEKQNLGFRVVTTSDHDTSFALFFPGRRTRSRATTSCSTASSPAGRRPRSSPWWATCSPTTPTGSCTARTTPAWRRRSSAPSAASPRPGRSCRLYDKWFLEPLPTGERLNRPMTAQLEESLHSLGLPE